MRKIFLILLTLILADMVFAQNLEKKSIQPTERGKMIFKINQKVEPGAVFEFLKKCDYEIQEGMKKGKPVSAIKYFTFATSAKIWIDSRWFIADTGLSKTWLEKIYKLLAYMSKTKRYVESATFNGRTKTEKFKKAVEYFDAAYKRFVKLIRKPVRASDKVIQREKVEKDMWQKRMRRKIQHRRRKTLV
ncbi:MAG: hypothetical protein KAS17_05770 [Victivallaceae bacterium]|nr:hypothetical protein [Victivallaceae bacterium]